MLDATEQYTNFKDRLSSINGVIIELTDDTSTWLFGNVEMNLTDGHVYNLLKTFDGIKQGVDIFKSTSTRCVVNIALSNAIYKRDSSDGSDIRVSDELSNIAHKEVKVYFTPNPNVKSLSECLMIFKGLVDQIKGYDEKQYKIRLADRNDIFDHQLLTKNVVDEFPDCPVKNKYKKIPIVYGQFLKNSTGCVKAYKCKKTFDWVVASHPVDMIDNIYIKEGGSYVFNVPEQYTNCVYGAVPYIKWLPDDDGKYILVSNKYKLAPSTCAKVTNTPDSDYEADGARFVHDDDLETRALTKVSSFYASPYVGDQELNDDLHFFSSQMFWDIADTDAAGNTGLQAKLMDEWKNAPNSTLNILAGKMADSYEGGPYDFVSDHTTSYSTLTSEYKFVYWLADVWGYSSTKYRAVTLTDVQTNWGDGLRPTKGPKFADVAGFKEGIVPQALGLMIYTAGDAYGIGLGQDTVTYMVYELMLQLMSFYTVNDKSAKEDEEGPWSLTAYAEVTGKRISAAMRNAILAAGADVSIGVPIGYLSFNFIINESARVLLSLLVDELGLSFDDIDVRSFNNAVAASHIVLNVTDEEATIRSVMTQLARQALYIPVLTPEGKVKLITLRYITSYTYPTDTTIKYDEIIPRSLKVGTTPENGLVNHLTVKHNWHAEKDEFLNEDVYTNTGSITKFGERKAIVEWKNVTRGFPFGALENAAKHLIDYEDNSDRGLWSSQHTTIEFKTFGQSNAQLQVGDRIELDDTTVDPHIKCNGESWSGKQFMVTYIHHSGKSSRIKAVCLPDKILF